MRSVSLDLRLVGLVGLVGLACLAGCRGPSHRIHYGGGRAIVLKSETLDDGSEVSWRLPAKGSDIHRSVAAVVVKPRVGVTVSTIDGATGETYGVKAWEGVLVRDVTSGSSAVDAGLAKGEIILSVDGEGLASQEEFWEVVRPLAQVGRPLDMEVLGRTNGDGVRPRRTVALVPDEERVTETRLDTYPMRTSARVQRLTGLQLGEIPADLAPQVFDADGPATLITGVMTGSPAYLAGLRRGDRIVACEGQDDPDLDTIIGAVDARAARLDVAAGLEPFAYRAGDEAPEATGPISLSVTGPLGWHTAEVAVAPHLEDRTEFTFPILFDWESDVNSLGWSFLDFIFQFGASYDRAYTESPTRDPRRWSSLSFFPFGMFEFETGPVWREYTFLWFITWKTKA